MIWPFSTSKGYGYLWIDGQREAAHVLACAHLHGPRPQGMDAAHGPCHNRRCWNPRHLSWKTRGDNIADKVRDGTHTSGDQHPSTKLSSDQVAALRTRYAAGDISQRALADYYAMSTAQVSDILAGRRRSAG